MRRIFITLFLLMTVCFCFAQSTDETNIRQMLAKQVEQWNAGDVAGYMIGYWESDSLLFIGAHGPRYGFRETLKKYKEAYPDAAHMGHLISTIKSMQRLSADYYFIVGAWALKRSVGDVNGSYTLLLRKINDQWVIVADHSS